MIKLTLFLAFLLIHLASASHHDSPRNGSSDLESSQSFNSLSLATTKDHNYGDQQYVQQPYGHQQYSSEVTEVPRLTIQAATLQALAMLNQAKFAGLLLKEYARQQNGQNKLVITKMPVSIPVLKLVRVRPRPFYPTYIKPAVVYPPQFKLHAVTQPSY